MNEETRNSASAEDIPPSGVTIEFSYSTHPSYDTAVALARRQPSYRELGAGTAVRHRVHYAWRELSSLQEMKHAVWDLHEKRALVNGVELRWEHMAQMTHCFHAKMTGGQRDHCFFDGNFVSPFGCRFTLTNLTDRIGHQWLTCGRFNTDGAFHFDKEQIRARAREPLRATGIDHCPAYDDAFVDVMVDVFPDQVHPDADARWRRMRTTSGAFVGVVPVDVAAAWKIVHELQEKVRQLRGPDAVDATGKRPVPVDSPAPNKKKGLLARLLGR